MHALIELQMPTEANLQLHFLPAKILADEVAELSYPVDEKEIASIISNKGKGEQTS
ncbi:uncharacterized protein ACN2A1_015123 isoform 3-T3 [Glossina fuscipes fuscipes]